MSQNIEMKPFRLDWRCSFPKAAIVYAPNLETAQAKLQNFQLDLLGTDRVLETDDSDERDHFEYLAGREATAEDFELVAE